MIIKFLPYTIYFSVFFVINSCGIKTFKLKNSITEVPSESNLYNNKKKFSKSLNNKIDTFALYEEYNMFNNTLERLNIQNPHCCYNALRFYGNGFLNYFTLDKESLFLVQEINPDYNGYRGVYYEDEKKIKFDLFIPLDQSRNIGRLSGNIFITNDTIYISNEKKLQLRKFVKNVKMIPKEYLNIEVNW